MFEQTVLNTLKKKLDYKKETFLLAVSTGVDSMVLLTLMLRLKKENISFGVAHVNHGLRKDAQKEADYLSNYCQKKAVPFYYKAWDNPPKINGIEAKARKFRYSFFAEVMKNHGYSVLLTAHHADDQLETMLMKMTREGDLKSAAGILYEQPFSTGRLVRPLLFQTKAEIRQFAETQKIVFFEDVSNQSMDFQRNRLRHGVVPQLKEENPQVLSHFQQLSESIIYANQWLFKQQERIFARIVRCEKDGYYLSAEEVTQLAPEELYFFCDYLLTRVSQRHHFKVNQKQKKQVLDLLQENKSQWQLDLSADWKVIRMYQQLVIQKETGKVKGKEYFDLCVGKGCYLSETQWLGVFAADAIDVPAEIAHWQEITQPLNSEFPQKFSVRKRQDGDRIRLTSQLVKRISRYFIDGHISQKAREESWILVDDKGEVFAVLPFVFSYLSIAQETDKIHYILLFKYQK